MKIIFSTTIGAITVSLLILIFRSLWMKDRLHFKLLKEMYPKSLNGVKTRLQFMWLPNYYKLESDVLFWFSFPYYFSKTFERKLTPKAIELELKLRKNNRQLVFFLLSFIGCFVILWLLNF